jgi:hypothetical protein
MARKTHTPQRARSGKTAAGSSTTAVVMSGAVAVVVVLAVPLLAACDQTPHTERTSDSVEQAAADAVDRSDDIYWEAAHTGLARIDLEGVTADVFAHATIVSVSSIVGHGENTWVAVTDEHAFVLPNDYNALVAQHPVVVDGSDDAWALVDLYLRMHEAQLAARGLEPIDTIAEAIGVTDAEVAAYEDQVDASTIEPHDSGWRARFVTWQHEGAALDRWVIDVDESGRIEAERDNIAYGVGDQAEID